MVGHYRDPKMWLEDEWPHDLTPWIQSSIVKRLSHGTQDCAFCFLPKMAFHCLFTILRKSSGEQWIFTCFIFCAPLYDEAKCSECVGPALRIYCSGAQLTITKKSTKKRKAFMMKSTLRIFPAGRRIRALKKLTSELLRERYTMCSSTLVQQLRLICLRNREVILKVNSIRGSWRERPSTSHRKKSFPSWAGTHTPDSYHPRKRNCNSPSKEYSVEQSWFATDFVKNCRLLRCIHKRVGCAHQAGSRWKVQLLREREIRFIWLSLMCTGHGSERRMKSVCCSLCRASQA